MSYTEEFEAHFKGIEDEYRKHGVRWLGYGLIIGFLLGVVFTGITAYLWAIW